MQKPARQQISADQERPRRGYHSQPDVVASVTFHYQQFFERRGLGCPPGLLDAVLGESGQELRNLIYWPDGPPEKENSLTHALDVLASSFIPAPENFLPLLPVDDSSIACVVCNFADEDADDAVRCDVVRWILSPVDAQYQAAVLDRDVALYLQSVALDIADISGKGRASVLERIKRRAAQYHEEYVEPGEQPRSYIERPIQLACQNVIVALATLQHDSSFDGLRVGAYLTCEVPHLATHEADRGLCAALLCDAFQNGSTMEMRFGPRNREIHVPSGLRRFGRSLDIQLGAEDPYAVSPAEARELFLAVTPMPDDLRMRAAVLMDRGVLAPERFCFTLMSSIWTTIELDYIVATSAHVISILNGGAEPNQRGGRLAELETCRAALMTGMFFRRLSKQDSAADPRGHVRVYEDAATPVSWTVDEAEGCVLFVGVEGSTPWVSSNHSFIEPSSDDALSVFPRALPLPEDFEAVSKCNEQTGSKAALLVTADMAEIVPKNVPVLICPDRLAELDQQIERKLSALRTGR